MEHDELLPQKRRAAGSHQLTDESFDWSVGWTGFDGQGAEPNWTPAGVDDSESTDTAGTAAC